MPLAISQVFFMKTKSFGALQWCILTSDVKWGQNLEAEAKTSKPRPELRGRGQFLEVEAKAEVKKIIMKKVLNND